MQTRTHTRARTRTRARAGENSPFLDRFGVFAECLLTGVWVLLAALPLVTAVAAMAAGSAHLRRYLDHEPSGWREFVADLRDAARHGWLVGLAGWSVLALLAADVAVASSGLPGGPLVAAAGILLALAVTVTGLRAAGGWRRGETWRPLLGRSARRTVRDPGGSALLAGGVAVVAVAAWQMIPLAAPALGCLAAACLAVERRDARR